MTRRLVIVALLLGVVAGACTQDPIESYLDRVTEITAAMRRSSIEAIPDPGEPTREGVGAINDARRRAAEQLDALDPPDELALEHAAVVYSLSALADAGDALLDSTAGLSQSAFVEALSNSVDLSALAERVASTCDALQGRATELGHPVDLRC